MNLRELIQLLRLHWLLLLTIPVVTAVSVFLFARSQDKKYTSDTVLYTGISTGYKIDGDNNSAGGGWNETNTAFDNLNALINSRDTKVEVALRLLAFHLTSGEVDPNSWKYELGDANDSSKDKSLREKLSGYFKFNFSSADDSTRKVILPASLKTKLKGATLEETTQKVMAYYNSSNKNALYRLVNSEHPVYSEDALSTVASSRIKDSDLLRIEYATVDPVVCRKTLEILTNVFIRKHKELYAGQNETVIGYFDEATQKSYDRLQAAEQKLLEFQKVNNIVDYDKQIVASTEDKQAALERYDDLEMRYAGAASALRSLESRLNTRGASNLKSQEIIRLRSRLSDLTSQITELEMLADSKSRAENAGRLARMKQEANKVSEDIKETIDSYYASSNSVEGANSSNSLLDEYAKNMILVEELKGQLNIMRNQKNTYLGQYNKLVPLGAEIRKIKREIEIAEQEYLSQVEGAKQSRLSEQNAELASLLKVVDPPYLPIKPERSKLLFLILGGFLGAFFVTAGGLVATDMLNTALKKPALASRITHYPVIGIMPKTDGLKEQQLLDVKRAEEQLSRQLLLKSREKKEEGPFVVGVLSSLSGEGKSAVCSSLANSLHAMGVQSHILFPDTHERLIEEKNRNVSFYSPLVGVSDDISVNELINRRINSKTVVIIEFPAVLENAYPVSLLQQLDLALVTADANRTWEMADRNIYKNMQKVMTAPIEVVLSSVLPEYVSEFIGTRVKASGKKRELLNLPPHPEQALLNP
ncbi:hypothetical protein [Pontibacter sp. SGAir0037]|uniref:hypothetical protein n=1 Tax=Pontibacter sp. SGAir0037 TaxID=2571030 RepID=UPI0010CD3479|nr:hypothetical protein [Pontibacter sp. SGAir0037]QCR22504.1 hypothetical protein C1N53_09255 [Pontibacter sp. SGAir0037]